MSTVNKNFFVNTVEILEKDFQEFAKANPEAVILNEQNYVQFLKDTTDSLLKAQNNQPLKDQLSENVKEQLSGLLKINLRKSNNQTEKVYVQVPSLVQENGLFGDNVITRMIGMSYKDVGSLIHKGKKANIGEIREWKGKKFQKTVNGWVPVKGGQGASPKKEESDILPGAEKGGRLEQDAKKYGGEYKRFESIANSVWDKIDGGQANGSKAESLLTKVTNALDQMDNGKWNDLSDDSPMREGFADIYDKLEEAKLELLDRI